MRREIKKSVVVQIPQPQIRSASRERSRDQHKQQRHKEVEVEEVNAQKRRELLKRMREREQEEEQYLQQQTPANLIKAQPTINTTQKQTPQNVQHTEQVKKQAIVQPSDASEDEQIREVVLHKPVFVGKEERETLRNQELMQQKVVEEHSKKIKIGRLNTKLLMNETLKAEGEEEEELEDSDSDNVDMPDDDDTKDEAMEYEYWKIRELKRIRRDREQRNKFAVQQADVERRRRMTDQERLAENKRLGSDLTDNTETTKYVYMQKYYHRGAFFQDSQQTVMKRDYNLPTAMELQDKTVLPKILQKRRNDFGKKGQSKHTHLADVDTTNFDPKTKANQSVMISLQKKMAGYKDSFLQNKK